MAAIAVVLQPEPRPNGLVSVLRPLPDGWERGVDLMVRSTPAPVRIGPCETGEDEPDLSGTPTLFQPVVIRQGVLCSLLGRPDTEGVSRAAVRVAAGYALSLELYDGAGTGNPDLADSDTPLTASTTLEEAVGKLEAAADTGLHGALAVIHIPVGLGAYIDMIAEPDSSGQLRTRAGNLVAVHGPGTTVYATGEVWGMIGSPDVRRYDDVRVNTSEAWGDIAAIVVFDPSTVWSSEVDAGS